MTPYYDEDGITIYHGEATSVLEHPDLLPPVAVVVADPPYSSGGMVRNDRNQSPSSKYQISTGKDHGEFSGDNRDQRSWTSWMANWLWLAWGASVPSALCFLFTDWRQLPATTDALQWGGWVWRGIVVWHKPSGRRLQNRFASDVEYVVWGSKGPMPFDLKMPAGPSSVVSVNAPAGSNRVHIAEKPAAVARHLLSLSAPDGVVLDPFVGTGPTLLAARDVGRPAVGIELEERYCAEAANRIAQGVLPL